MSRKDQSLKFLQKIDQIEAEIKSTVDDRVRLNQLRDERARLCRQFAKHLSYGQIGGSYSPFFDRGRHVEPYWLVEGVPSKKHLEEAKSWVKERNIDWDGSARSFRHAFKQGINFGDELLPDHHFGLHVEYTVRIDMDPTWVIFEDLERKFHELKSEVKINH